MDLERRANAERDMRGEDRINFRLIGKKTNK